MWAILVLEVDSKKNRFLNSEALDSIHQFQNKESKSGVDSKNIRNRTALMIIIDSHFWGCFLKKDMEI